MQWECTNESKCALCGGCGHRERDCSSPPPQEAHCEANGADEPNEQIDVEREDAEPADSLLIGCGSFQFRREDLQVGLVKKDPVACATAATRVNSKKGFWRWFASADLNGIRVDKVVVDPGSMISLITRATYNRLNGGR
jgi:hypothetical protein